MIAISFGFTVEFPPHSNLFCILLIMFFLGGGGKMCILVIVCISVIFVCYWNK